MAVDTWGCDFGFIDRNGKLLGNPVSYRDKPRHEQVPAPVQDASRAGSSSSLSPGRRTRSWALYQLFSFKCDDAPELREGHRLLMIPDLLNYLLTGRACNEYTDATMALICDQKKRTWEKRILARLGIPDSFLGEIVMPGDTDRAPPGRRCARSWASRPFPSSPRRRTTPPPP